MPSAIAIRAFGSPTMIKLYQPPSDIPTILHALDCEGIRWRRGVCPVGPRSLSAQAAIREVLEISCRAMDRIDDPLSRATWLPGGRTYYEGIFDGTGEEFCDWVAGFHRGFGGPFMLVSVYSI